MRSIRPPARSGIALATLLALGTSIASAQPATPNRSPAAERDLTIVNKSSRVVNELYVSPSTADQWGDDRLGDDTIDPGKSYRARLGRSRDCEFDVQVVYDDASHEESRKVNLCRTRQLAFDGSTAEAAPEPAGAAHTVTLFNHSARPIQQVFISPAESAQWGDDRLDDASISTGDSSTVTYQGECLADLRVIFDNKGAEERRALDLCATPTLSIEPGWTTADDLPTVAPQAAKPHTSPPPPAPLPPPVTVLNKSGHDAVELYVFPADRPDHGPDFLGLDTLPAGGARTINPERGTSCKFAAHVVYGGKVPDQEVTGLDLCQSAEITIPAP